MGYVATNQEGVCSILQVKAYFALSSQHSLIHMTLLWNANNQIQTVFLGEDSH